MRFIQALLAWIVPIASARILEPGETNNKVVPDKEFLIETAPGETRWITLDDKWELRRNGQRFMDITATQDLGTVNTAAKESVEYPYKCVRGGRVKEFSRYLNERLMRRNLEKLTSFHTRYYDSGYGRQSSEWVLDSINLWLPTLAAPGADDGGSGTVTIMEVFRALLLAPNIQRRHAINTIEFHWYSAEEGGLLGSQAIFMEYEKKKRDVKAMLQQDMIGYIKGTLDVGLAERFGVVVDHVDAGLTRFMKTVIEQYCSIPWVETKCGYACSDHASAFKAGYPSAFVMPSSFENSNQLIHNSSDLIDNVSFHHMLEHARMTLGFAYELAFHRF